MGTDAEQIVNLDDTTPWEDMLTPRAAIDALTPAFGDEAAITLWGSFDKGEHWLEGARCRLMRVRVEGDGPMRTSAYREVRPGYALWQLLSGCDFYGHELVRAIHATGDYIYRHQEQVDGKTITTTTELFSVRVFKFHIETVLLYAGHKEIYSKPLPDGTARVSNADVSKWLENQFTDDATKSATRETLKKRAIEAFQGLSARRFDVIWSSTVPEDRKKGGRPRKPPH